MFVTFPLDSRKPCRTPPLSTYDPTITPALLMPKMAVLCAPATLMVLNLKASFGASAYGRVYGFVYSGLDVGMALTPLLFGRLLDAGLFRSALVGIAVLQIGALLSALAVRDGAAAGSRRRTA